MQAQTMVKKASSSEVPWDKSIKQEELSKPGGLLMAMLFGRAQQLGQTGQEMALELGVTYGFIGQLRSGVRQTCNVDDRHLLRMAEYLGVPKVVVLLAAGKLNVDDFFEDDSCFSDGILNAALQIMAQDPVCGIPLPADAYKASYELKVYLITLYEATTGRRILRTRWLPDEAINFLDRIGKGKETKRNPALMIERPSPVTLVVKDTDS